MDTTAHAEGLAESGHTAEAIRRGGQVADAWVITRNDRVDLLDELLSQLPARERETIRMRFGLGGVPDNAPTPTLREIAKIRGVTAERIRVVVKTALGRLQAIAKAGGRQAS
jgi:DNA-directed RNA polymerase sigma subunit (sigma70/sigma32)